MPVDVFRVCRREHGRLDGEGARLVGGRWNSPGTPVVYMAQSVALAVLENLVHMSRRDYPAGYAVIAATIPRHVPILDEYRVREDRRLSNLTGRQFGDEWAAQRLSAVLRVRSAVVPSDFNYLLNPLHLDFAQIAIHPPAPFVFDERLFD